MTENEKKNWKDRNIIFYDKLNKKYCKEKENYNI